MITINLFRNQNHDIYGFRAKNHGDSFVCAAVSALTINTVNSIEAFCDVPFLCDYDPDGGYLHFEVPMLKEGGRHHDVTLLLNAMALGLADVAKDHAKDVTLKEVFA